MCVRASFSMLIYSDCEKILTFAKKSSKYFTIIKIIENEWEKVLKKE